MSPGPLQRWRERSDRKRRVERAFDDIMELALALLAVSADGLKSLGWSFADRKRLLDHFLASGKAAQRIAPDKQSRAPLMLSLPNRDIYRLRRFARRELPKAASNAVAIDRILAALDPKSPEAAGRCGR